MRPLIETYAEYMLKICAIRLSKEVKELHEYDPENEVVEFVEKAIVETARLILEQYDGDSENTY